jgi:hypothetical protein
MSLPFLETAAPSHFFWKKLGEERKDSTRGGDICTLKIYNDPTTSLL